VSNAAAPESEEGSGDGDAAPGSRVDTKA